MKTAAFTAGCILTLLGLSFAPGCSTTYLRISEPPHQNPGLILPIEVRIEMKTRTKKLSGELIEWDNGVLTIQGKSKHQVRTDNIKRMEIGSSARANMGYGCLAGAGASALIWVILILII
jgi:hypothetical protein